MPCIKFKKVRGSDVWVSSKNTRSEYGIVYRRGDGLYNGTAIRARNEYSFCEEKKEEVFLKILNLIDIDSDNDD